MLLEAGEILMARAKIREDQIEDIDNLSESEHDVLVHENLVTSGTLNFQNGTISGIGDVYATDYYGDGSNLTGVSVSGSNPTALYYDDVKKIEANNTGITFFGSDNQEGFVYFVGGKYTFENNVTNGPMEFYQRDNTGNKEAVMVLDTDSGHDFYVKQSLGVKMIQTGLWIMGGSQSLYTQITQTGANFLIQNSENSGTVTIDGRNSSSSYVRLFVADPDGASALYHAGVKTIFTTSDQLNIAYGGNTALAIGSSGGKHVIYSYDNGKVFNIQLEDSGGIGRTMLLLDPDGAAEIYHAGDKALETVVSGVEIPVDNFMYFGDTTTSGSWRMGISGEDFIHQKYDGSGWETKQTVVG